MLISAGGKSNVFGEIMKHLDCNILVIADGAAFGAEMDRVMKLVKRFEGIVLYLPESFEWLILSSGVITGKNLKAILEKTEEFVESKDFFSWERYFTNLLVTLTKDSYMRYSKRKLNRAYLHEDTLLKIVEQMNGIEL